MAYNRDDPHNDYTQLAYNHDNPHNNYTQIAHNRDDPHINHTQIVFKHDVLDNMWKSGKLGVLEIEGQKNGKVGTWESEYMEK